ncbi:MULTISPECIES: sugar ABC transporter substrate-binding protein [Sinorhizobium]|uniref:Sugar ABC transporter n=1 Tax=Sinorhizobium americanum TaxID=194963 RepID=A0A2S3YNQ1_9HYPH|nr:MULTISPECIES: sugar ABC transporter substrate-binding protein [Sinorhizobium]PDT42629.1 sugar ABC transporter [Sinorhizobium sp. FG01]POH32556.1 sugar ABC transporter [Sinorhizobium americanum]
MKFGNSILLSALMAATALGGIANAQDGEKQYRFVMVSHIGSNDPNMGWLTKSMEEFEKKYPNVKTEYISTNNYSVQEHVRLLEQAISTQPDGIAVPIVSSDAFEAPLRKAIEAGIPVVAFNIPDGRPDAERIPYLTYVGGDEYLTGKKLGEYALEKAEAGEIPKPTRVVCASHDSAHQGLKARCAGMKDAMEKAGAKVDELFIGAEPATARNALQAFLQANPDTNYIFTVAGWSSPWAWGVANDMKLDPEVDDKGVTVLTVDEGPVSIEGVRAGHVLATNSQGFWLQGYAPMEWLYWNKEFGYAPQSNILTGPVIINKDNADQWAELVRGVFGDKAYDEQNTW